MKKQYSVNDEQKKQFASLYVLDLIINDKVKIPLLLEGNNCDLEPVLEYLLMKQYCTVENKKCYTATEKGYEVLRRFMKRYSEFLKIFDIYCAVDLEDGCFAFEEYFDFSDEIKWKNYLEDERWEDLRIAVAIYKKLDPVEIVFMSFLKEKQFGDRGEGWQFDLLLGSIWDEILAVCNSALTAGDLGYSDDDGTPIDGNTVLEDIITQGAEINLALHQEEEKRRMEEERTREEEDDDEIMVEEIEPVVYEYYCQPMYISPLWALVLFI